MNPGIRLLSREPGALQVGCWPAADLDTSTTVAPAHGCADSRGPRRRPSGNLSNLTSISLWQSTNPTRAQVQRSLRFVVGCQCACIGVGVNLLLLVQRS